MREYRVVHELGPHYAVPAHFHDFIQAQECMEAQKRLAEKIGMGHTADGWYIESRPIAVWEKEDSDG